MNTVKMRRGCNPKEGLKRGAWTSQEDKILSDYIKAHGLGRWRSLPANAGLNRCGKSCRLRWLNYLRPDIKRGNITEEEEELIIRLHKLLGNRWSLIAGRLPGRTDNEIKNYWNTYLRKKVRGEISEQQPSSRAKKASSTKKPSTEKKQISEVNVKRTKAVRCTRPLFTDGHILTPPSNSDFVSNLSANANKDETWIAEIMQNSLLSQVSRDSSYTSPGNNSLQTIGDNGTSCFNEENYMRGLFSSCNREGEGLYYSFLDPDSSWESLVVTQKS